MRGINLLDFVDHLLPVLITMLIVGLVFLVKVGFPYLHYIHLVADADSEEGVNLLAKYLAKTTGGKRIDVDDAWESFIPAAKALHKAYAKKTFKDLLDKAQAF